ncbi:MAG: DNA-3-methyladenine glycosylase 2 family protein [Clostridia bacterium]|nr:DNA-3-methyladenine glycosylase 2 family protein [Clostridia bacterium]
MCGYKLIEEKDGVLIKTADGSDIIFDPDKTFDCGQCFRFNKDEEGRMSGVALGRAVGFKQHGRDGLYIYGASAEEFGPVWKEWLALDVDYEKVNRELTENAGENDPVIAAAEKVSRGIRILRQDRWEALCSFIISQNNNIPRIKKIIEAISERWGERIDSPVFGTRYSFPTAEALANAGEKAIYDMRTGFRAKYITDAAEKVASGKLDLEAVAGMNNDEAFNTLLTVKGVGPKVANCALLFGFGRFGLFPIDVWIKRVLEKYYPADFDPSVYGEWAGLAQQYLFYYERYLGGQ